MDDISKRIRTGDRVVIFYPGNQLLPRDGPFVMNVQGILPPQINEPRNRGVIIGNSRSYYIFPDTEVYREIGLYASPSTKIFLTNGDNDIIGILDSPYLPFQRFINIRNSEGITEIDTEEYEVFKRI